MVGVAALLLVANRVGSAQGSFDHGFSGRLFARTDIATPLVIIAAAYIFGRRYLRLDHTRVAVRSTVRDVASFIGTLWVGWWALLLINVGAIHPGGGLRRLVMTAIFFRTPRDTIPLPGASIGPLLLVIAVAAALSGLLGIVASRIVGEHRGAQAVLGKLLGALFVAGWLIRILAVATRHTSQYGLFGYFVGALDLLAVGFAISHFGRAPRRRQVICLSALAVLAGLVSLLLQPRTDLIGGQFLGRSALQAVCVASIIYLVAQRLQTGFTVMRRLRWVALAAPGVLLFGETAFIVVARQYRERVTQDGAGIHLSGPLWPPLIWTIALGVAFGIASAAGPGLIAWRVVRGVWPWVSHRVLLCGIIASAFLFRVWALLAIAPERTDGGDPLFYHTTANMLAQGRGFSEPLNWIAYGKQIPSAVHGPLYPVVLSLSSRIGGTTYFDHKMLSCMIGAALVGVVGVLTTRIAGKTAGALAAIFATFYPNLWIIDGVLFPEGLTALLTTLAIWAGYRWRDRPTLARAIGIGALLGLAVLTRGEAISLLVLFVAPWMWWHHNIERRQRLWHIAATGLACIVVLVPWTVRNMSVFKEFVPLSTNSNDLLTYANCDETYSGKFLGFWLYDCQEQVRRKVGEPQGDESQKAVFWRKNGLTYVKNHVGELPKVIAARIGRQWELFRPLQNVEFAPIEGRNRVAAGWGLAMYYGLAFGSIGGAVQLRRRRISALPFYAVLLNVTATAALAYGTTRFRAPAEPVLCILAGIGAAPLVVWLRRRFAPVEQSSSSDGSPISDSSSFVLGGSALLGKVREGRDRLRWQTWVSVGAVAGAVALPLRGLYRATGSTMEEGFMLTFPERVLAGDVPNVDFLHLYGPGSLDALAGWYQIFGVTLSTERTFGLLQQLGIVTGIWVVARAWGRLVATMCAAFSVIFVFTPIGLQALAWSGAVGIGLWSVAAGMRSRSGIPSGRLIDWAAASGVLAGLAIAFRPDIGLALALAHGFLLWRSPRWKRFVAGAVAGLIPLWIHFVRAGPITAIKGMILDPIFHLRAGRELPRPPSWSHMDGALQVIGEKFPPWWGLPSLQPSQQLALWFFVLPLVALGLLGVAVIVYRRSDQAPRTTLLVAAALFGVGLLPQAFQRPDSAHFLWVACVSWPLAPLGLIELWHIRSPRTHPTLRTIGSVMAVAVLTLVVAPFFTYRTYLANTRQSLGQLPGGLPVTRGDRTFYMGDARPARASQQVVDELGHLAKPGERLLVGPVDLRATTYSDAVFYYMFPELTPGTYFIEMDPGLANAAGSRLATDVASSDWLILTRFWSGWIEPNDSVVFGSDVPNQVVERDFCLVKSFENDLVRLMHKCAGGGAPGPYEGPYDPRYDYAVEVRVPVPPRPDGTCTPTCNGVAAPGAFGPP